MKVWWPKLLLLLLPPTNQPSNHPTGDTQIRWRPNSSIHTESKETSEYFRLGKRQPTSQTTAWNKNQWLTDTHTCTHPYAYPPSLELLPHTRGKIGEIPSYFFILPKPVNAFCETPFEKWKKHPHIKDGRDSEKERQIIINTSNHKVWFSWRHGQLTKIYRRTSNAQCVFVHI